MEGSSLPSPKVGFVEEFSHFCECPRCFVLCYSLSESEVETFLCTQFFRTEDILRDSHPSLSGQIGSFRLWLDWNRFFPALRAFLLAVGTFQTISVGVSSENQGHPYLTDHPGALVAHFRVVGFVLCKRFRKGIL